VQTFFPLLKTFLELFSADVQDRQHFLFYFADISKTFPFHLAFHMREQEKVEWHMVWWIERMSDFQLFPLNCNKHSNDCFFILCQQPRNKFCGKMFHIQIFREHSLTWNARKTSYLRNLINGSTTICIDCVANFSRFSSFQEGEGRPDLGWSSHDISPPLKHEYHSHTWVLLKASSLKASCSIKTVSASDFPNRKQTSHTLFGLYYQPS